MASDLGASAPDAESGAGQSGTAEPSAAEPGAAEPSTAEARPQVAADEAAAGQKPASSRKKRRKRPLWRDLFVIVVAAIFLTTLLKAYVVQVFSIPSGSMENTL